VACRRPDNEIIIQEEPVESYLGKLAWLNKPFIRGTLALIDSMIMGIKALTFSANIAMEEPEQEASEGSEKPKVETAEEPVKKPSQSINDIAVGASLFLGLGLGVVLFVFIPQLLTGLLGKLIHKSFLLNLTEGLVRIVFFLAYIYSISLLKDIRRVFEYHGAEHKVINTFESGLDLVPENFAKFTTIHPRCGTSFITAVLLISIVVYSCVGWHAIWYIRIAQRLLLLPVIAGIGYELIRFAGKHRDSKLFTAFVYPGLLLQKLTTRPPSDDQVEVALAALQAVMKKEEEAGA
jgi:uncharacterized protein YqhQ